MKNYKAASILLLLLLGFTSQLLALSGNTNSHDPSAIIKDGTKFWKFTTGDGIYAAYSTDLYQWTAGRKRVFPIGTWPSWINEYVPEFNGHFWAPECVYMNGKYYLYYSCSTFGSSTSVIGLATSPTLDQESPNYKWTDLGMVVSSSSKADINAIDPAILKDSDGRVYMTYGSFSGGIGIIELDSISGKVKTGATLARVAGGNDADWEAPALVKEGSYYYLFVNRGFCCRGLNSTYTIVMGRSTNIAGPYLDKNGVDLRNNGGTLVLGSSGKYVAPGHFGLLRHNGSNFVSMHYYDGSDNGNAKLDIANLGFSNGWPFITRDWIAQGRYKITNNKSGLVWDSWGCTGTSGEAIAQGSWANLDCQQWDFIPVGDGFYRINNAKGGLSADVINCNPDNGAKLQLWTWLDNNCQKFKVYRLEDGSHVFMSATGTRVVEVPGGSTTAGVQLALYSYNGRSHQKWAISSPNSTLSSSMETSEEKDDILLETILKHKTQVFPNPARGGSFTIELGKSLQDKEVDIEIFSMDNKIIYKARHFNQPLIPVDLDLRLTQGFYLVRISSRDQSEVLKLLIKD